MPRDLEVLVLELDPAADHRCDAVVLDKLVALAGSRDEVEEAVGIGRRFGGGFSLRRGLDRDTLIRMIVDETKRGLRADASTIRLLRDDRLEVTAWAGLPDEVAGRLPVMRRDEGWVGEVLPVGRILRHGVRVLSGLWSPSNLASGLGQKAMTLLMPAGLPRIRSGACSGG